MTKIWSYSTNVAEKLDTEFLSGRTESDFSRLLTAVEAEELESAIDVDLLRGLCTHALELGLDSGSKLDAWLSPRLHAGLRIPPRIAGDPGFWRWLAIDVFSPYVQARWCAPKSGLVTRWRYTGSDVLRNAVSRLWWGAELVRNGSSYELVPVVFRRVRTAEFALELSYSRFRAAAIAFTRVAEGLDGGPALTDLEMPAVSKRANAYLTLRSLEAMGLEAHDKEGFDHDWHRHRPALADLVVGELPTGPSDGLAPPGSVTELERWFRELHADVNSPGD